MGYKYYVLNMAFKTYSFIMEGIYHHNNNCLVEDWGNYERSDKYTYIIKCGTKDKYR